MPFKSRYSWNNSPCTKHNYLVKDIKKLAGAIHSLFVAKNGRPGPVLVDIPKDTRLLKQFIRVKIN